MKIEFRRGGLKFVRLIEKTRANHFKYWNEVRQLNGGPEALLRAANEELKRLLALAVHIAGETGIALTEIELEGPNLMDASCWGGYKAAPWDFNCHAERLGLWFEREFGSGCRFYINSFYDPRDPDIKEVIRIDFSPRNVRKHPDDSFLPGSGYLKLQPA